MDPDLRAKAQAIKSEHKALGVVCFGYFRYRNARFGCAEVHQAIQAYGRAGMTRAREIAQSEGYEMVHTMTDCTFLWRPGVTRADALRIARRIGDEVGVPMDVEGVYKWIVFLPSKTHSTTSDVGVPNRYYGKFEDGSLKVRGIEVQRHSTPPLVFEVQQGMLDVLGEADDAAGFHARIPRALAVAKAAALRLRRREVPPEDLAVMVQARMSVEEYRTPTRTRAALRRLRDAGTERRPGEYVQYIVQRSKGPWEGRVVPTDLGDTPDWLGTRGATYDIVEHLRLLARSVETLLAPFGYREENVLRWFLGKGGPRETEHAQIDVPARPEWEAV